MSDFINRHAQIAASCAVLLGLFGGTISFFGGSFPPYPSVQDFRQLRLDVDVLKRSNNFQRCEDWNRRLRNATSRLQKDPSDNVERENAFVAREGIRGTEGCEIERLP